MRANAIFLPERSATVSQLTILCSGDLHLGRVSSKWGRDDEDATPYTARAAWARIVDSAISQRVDLLMLTGDLADDGGNQYEALGPLELGLSRLREHDIATLLVAGNHDARVLARLAPLLDHPLLRLLGRQGEWEQIAWPPAAPQFTVAGWSYPERGVRELPLDDFPPAGPVQLPRIALAHTDFTGGPAYAAVTPERLAAVPGVDLWLLGHIHAPTYLPGPSALLNPGSPQALDPGEPGVHGPWHITIRDGRLAEVTQLPLSTVAYTTLDVEISALRATDDLLTVLLPALTARRTAWALPAATRLSCRLRLSGRTPVLNKIVADADLLLREQPLLETHNLYLDQLDTSSIGPAYDLPTLRVRGDAIGALAGVLDDLERGVRHDGITTLLQGAEEIARRVSAAPAHRGLGPLDGAPEAVTLLRAEGRRLLDALLAQEEERV